MTKCANPNCGKEIGNEQEFNIMFYYNRLDNPGSNRTPHWSNGTIGSINHVCRECYLKIEANLQEQKLKFITV